MNFKIYGSENIIVVLLTLQSTKTMVRSFLILLVIACMTEAFSPVRAANTTPRELGNEATCGLLEQLP